MSITWPLRGAAVACAGLVLAVVVSVLNSGGATAITNCSTNSAGLNAAEQQLLQLHNEERARAGLTPLTASPSLNRAAAWKSEDSSATPPGFGHTDSLNRNPTQRAMDCGYPGSAGENIAYGYTSAQSVFNGWMNSTGHRNNILNPNYRAIGIGLSGTAWTVKFGFSVESGGPSPTPTTPAATATPTRTPVPPTATPTRTTVPPTATPTNTTVPPTATPTGTVAPPTATPTGTVAPPTATPTGTAVPPTATPTGTVAPPTATPTSTPPGPPVLAGISFITYTLPTVDVETGIADIAHQVYFIYHYDAETDQWLRYVPRRPSYVNTLKLLETGKQYFIAVRGAVEWPH